MGIGEKLLDLRKSKGYSQEEVAEKLGVTRQTVSKWETEQSSPDFDKIVPLCELYEISTDKLLKGSKETLRENSIIYEDESKRRKATAKAVSISVFLYILSIAWILLGIEFFGLNEVLVISTFLLICGIATIILIYHFVSLPKSKEELRMEKIKENKKYKSITSITATLFTIVYLLISFATMAWHITWIIWLVYAVVEEIIKIVVDPEVDENE